MLLDSCGDQNRVSPVTNHPRVEESFVCNFVEREFFSYRYLGSCNLLSLHFDAVCPEDWQQVAVLYASLDRSISEFPLDSCQFALSFDYRFHAFIDNAIHRGIRKVVALSAGKQLTSAYATGMRTAAFATAR